jgi:glycosyltransferase involved in cell wall biosynthesis
VSNTNNCLLQDIAEECYGMAKEGWPLVTVITVVYNGQEYLEDAIKSVIGQSYPNIEYIVIDGGSTDGTLDIIHNVLYIRI